jgi:ATP-binding cassette subfamily B protein
MAAVMRGLEAEAYDRQYDDRELIRRIGHYFGAYRSKAIIIIITVFVMAILGASLPLIISNGVGIMADDGNPAVIPLLIGIIFFVGIITWITNWIRRQLTSEVIADVVMSLRNDAFEAAARQDLSFYDEFSSGRVVSRITSDTEEFGQVVTLSTDVVNQLFVAVILIGVLFTIEWRLTLAVLVMAPFVALAALGFRRVARRVTQQSSRAMGEVNKSIQEAVTGIGVAKNFRQEGTIYQEFKTVNEESYKIMSGGVLFWPTSSPP